MEVLGLPGRNPETEAWMAGLLGALGLGAGRTAHYRHWDDGGEPDITGEAQRLSGLEPDLVIAKSMGTLVAVTAHSMHDFRPRAAVLIGSPIGDPAPEVLMLYTGLANAVPTLFIQQEEDVVAPFSAVEAVAKRSRLGEAVVVPGSDHVYADVDALVSLIERWRDVH
jgi:pimeloyl-ACP methyl ester carboxylesterase